MRGRLGQWVVVATAVTGLSGCSRQVDAVVEQDVPGRYRGIARADLIPRPFRSGMTLRPDHSFAGDVLVASGGYASRSGRWRLGQGADCRRLDLISAGSEPIAACIGRLSDGTICLSWTGDTANGCAMTRTSA